MTAWLGSAWLTPTKNWAYDANASFWELREAVIIMV